MHKRNLANLALLGITAGLMMSGCQKQSSGQTSTNKADEQMSQDMQKFYNSLTPEGQSQFMQLDAQHKTMAIQMMQSSCNGKNSCQGLGGCATPSHACAGKNGCKGQGGAQLKNPNDAVSIQFHNQMSQRQQTNGSMGS